MQPTHKLAFISHASSDGEQAEKIYSSLKERGIECWLDKHDIKAGIPYARAIINGIAECEAMVVLISKSSVMSENVLNEIDKAHREKKLLIPVFLEDYEMNEEFQYYLNRRQWIKAYESFENGIELLHNALVEGLHLKVEDEKNTSHDETKNFFLKVKPNIDCAVIIDEEEIGEAKANKITKFPLRPGEYTLSFTSKEDDRIFYKLYNKNINITNCDILVEPQLRVFRKKYFSDSELLDSLSFYLQFTFPDAPIMTFERHGDKYMIKKKAYAAKFEEYNKMSDAEKAAAASATLIGTTAATVGSTTGIATAIGGIAATAIGTGLGTVFLPALAVGGLTYWLFKKDNSVDKLVKELFLRKGIEIEVTSDEYIISILRPSRNRKYFVDILSNPEK